MSDSTLKLGNAEPATLLGTGTSVAAAATIEQPHINAPPHNPAPILPPYVEKRPFIRPGHLRSFGVSALVAGGCFAAIYYMMASSAAAATNQHYQALRKLKAAEADRTVKIEPFVAPPAPKIPEFRAPSLVSFDELTERARRGAPIIPELATPRGELSASSSTLQSSTLAAPTPLLHQEIARRVIETWNATLDRMEQLVLDADEIIRVRRLADVERAARMHLAARGLTEVEIVPAPSLRSSTK